MTIAIDFDGTCVTHEYPEIGRDLGATTTLKTLVDNGHKLVLHTMRCGETLDQAVQWFKDRNIPLFGINENPTQKKWTASPKIFANLYIDDAALGAPLLRGAPSRPYMDWRKVILDLEDLGALLPEDLSRCLSTVIEAQAELDLFQ